MYSHRVTGKSGYITNVLHKVDVDPIQEETFMDGIQHPGDENVTFYPHLVRSSIQLKVWMSREKKGSKTTSRNISRAERRKRKTKSKFKGDPIDEGGGKRG